MTDRASSGVQRFGFRLSRIRLDHRTCMTSESAGRRTALRARCHPVRLNTLCDCEGQRHCYRQSMSSKIDYDVYRGTADRSLRLATLPGAGLPGNVKRKDWVLMPKGKPPFPYDIDRDIAVKGYCFFQLTD